MKWVILTVCAGTFEHAGFGAGLTRFSVMVAVADLLARANCGN